LSLDLRRRCRAREIGRPASADRGPRSPRSHGRTGPRAAPPRPSQSRQGGGASASMADHRSRPTELRRAGRPSYVVPLSPSQPVLPTPNPGRERIMRGGGAHLGQNARPASEGPAIRDRRARSQTGQTPAETAQLGDRRGIGRPSEQAVRRKGLPVVHGRRRPAMRRRRQRRSLRIEVVADEPQPSEAWVGRSRRRGTTTLDPRARGGPPCPAPTPGVFVSHRASEQVDRQAAKGQVAACSYF
jgi:hypothetical protein